jgi:hypothetical protein
MFIRSSAADRARRQQEAATGNCQTLSERALEIVNWNPQRVVEKAQRVFWSEDVRMVYQEGGRYLLRVSDLVIEVVTQPGRGYVEFYLVSIRDYLLGRVIKRYPVYDITDIGRVLTAIGRREIWKAPDVLKRLGLK